MDTNTNYVRILVETLRKKEQVLTEILEITKKQAELAKRDTFDEESFTELLDRKEVLIDELNKLDDGFDAVYERVRQTVLAQKHVYQTELMAMQASIKNCTELGVQIQTLEHQNRDKIEQQFRKQKQEIRQVRKSSSVATNYYKTMSNLQIADPVFMDKKK